MAKRPTGKRASQTASFLRRSPLEARPEIHQVTLPLPAQWRPHQNVQVYLVEADPLTLVDTGVRSRESQAALEAALEGLGFEFRDIERIVVTHAHRDHMGLVETIRRAGADLECLAHTDDAEMIESFTERLPERLDDLSDLFREHGLPESVLKSMRSERLDELRRERHEAENTRVDRRLREGDRIAYKDFSLRVRHSPGHTAGHLMLEEEAAQLLFTGDQVMANAIPSTETFYTSPHPEPGDPLARRPRFKGLSAMRRSLKQLRGRPFRALLPGYGGIVKRPERAVRDTLLFYEVRLQRIERGLRHLAAMGQEVTAYDLLKSLYPENSLAADRRVHMLTLIGALDCLEEDGLLMFERRADGVLTVRHC